MRGAKRERSEVRGAKREERSERSEARGAKREERSDDHRGLAIFETFTRVEWEEQQKKNRAVAIFNNPSLSTPHARSHLNLILVYNYLEVGGRGGRSRRRLGILPQLNPINKALVLIQSAGQDVGLHQDLQSHAPTRNISTRHLKQQLVPNPATIRLRSQAEETSCTLRNGELGLARMQKK